MKVGLHLAITRSDRGGPRLARPSAPAFSLAPGASNGQIDVTVTDTASMVWGDAATPGDGLGSAGIYEWHHPSTGWQTLDDPAADATTTVSLAEAYHGTTQTIRVRAVNDEGVRGTPASDTVEVPADILEAPANTVAPVISGSPIVGQTLSVSTGTWTGNPAPSFTYQWLGDDTPISGATGSTYELQPADDGTTVKCSVTATNSEGSDSADSNGVLVGIAGERLLLETGDLLLLETGDALLLETA